jgi:hypothetical protein
MRVNKDKYLLKGFVLKKGDSDFIIEIVDLENSSIIKSGFEEIHKR